MADMAKQDKPTDQVHSEEELRFMRDEPVVAEPTLTPTEQVIKDLTDWWVNTAKSEVLAVAPKAVEYGSQDLVEMGRTLARVSGRDLDPSPYGDVQAAELGIWFYVIGKMARWTAAVDRDEAVSDDTLHDIGVYVKMVQRMRYQGDVWPK